MHAIRCSLDAAPSRVAAALLMLCTLSGKAAETAIEASTPAPAKPWTSLDANDAEQDFHFVLVSDRTGGARHGVFESAIPKVNTLEPAFVMSVGDLIEGNTRDQARLDREWDEFEGLVAGLDAPFFYVAGNHDMSNAVMAETWQARFGPSYYRFVYKDVLFLVLNSELFGMVRDPKMPVPGPWTQADQLAFIEQTLAEFPNPRWTIVVIHQALWDYADGARGWPQVEAMLGQRDYTVFAGHFHRYVKAVRQSRKYITLATTGGGSAMRGEAYGEFDHVAWVTMTGTGPRIANLMLDGIHDENVVTLASRAAVRTLAGAVRPRVEFDANAAPESLFEASAPTFEIANSGRSELRVAYHVAPGPEQRFVGEAAPIAVPPGAVREVAIPLAADRPIPYHELRAGRVAWRLSTDTRDGPLDLPITSALLPVAPLPLPSGTKPHVDGHLDDWPVLPFAVERQGDIAAAATAPTDIAFTFGLREAEGDVYFAARVRDDSVFASPEWEDVRDGLEIVVDARPEPRRSENLGEYAATRRGDFADLAVVLAQPAPAPPPTPRRRARWQTQLTEDGYTVEAVVSGDFLNAKAGDPWRVLRIGVAAEDWDAGEIANPIPVRKPGSAATLLHWQPDRFGTAPVAGSGTFVRLDRSHPAGRQATASGVNSPTQAASR